MPLFNIFKNKKPEERKEKKEEKIVKPVEKQKKVKVEKPKVDELRSSPPFANRASKGSEGGKEDEALFDYARVKKAVLEVKPRKIKEKKTGMAYRILRSPQITEKSTALAEKNQYVFKVYPKTNKIEIKTAIEDLYNVDVLSVRIIKVRRKKRRLGRISGWRAGYKKAVVKIKAGQKIEVMPR
jgi:large subunit ribosomal protein L23